MTIAKKIAKNNNNVDTANKNSYIFTTYSTRTGFDSNGYTNDVESIEIKCDTLGNADTFNGLYREVVFFDADRKNGWDIKTTDGKILAKGTTEDELRKAYDNLAKAEVTTATDNTNAPEVARFQIGTTYRYYDANTGEPLWYITIDKRTNTTVTVSGEKFKVFIQPHDRLLNYDKPTESFIRGNYRIDAADACEETADEITPSTLQKFIEAKKEVSYWRNSTGARIWQIAYIRYGVNGGIVGQTPWLNCTIKEADKYLKDEYGMTLLEYLAAEDKWNDTDKGAILKDKIERDSKPSVETMPALFPAEDGDDDELIDTPSVNNAKTITPDEMLATLDTMNAAAPYGWQIDYDGKNFPVKFNDKIVTTLDSLALTKVLPPDKFFEQFNPDVPPKEHYINERRKELDMLLDFRKFVEDDSDRLKTLANLIEDVKREILNAELDTEHPPDIEFDEHGDVIPWF